jgi:ATP-dependent Clp protease ATP-binding subunit ClpX
MYELPSLEGVSKVVIDGGVIEGDSDPIMIFDGGEKQLSLSKD